MKNLTALVKEFRIFGASKYPEAVQKAREAGFTPASIADIAKEASNNRESVCFWSGDTFYTADAIAFQGQRYSDIRKIKFVSANQLPDSVPDTELDLGARLINDNDYLRLKGTEFVKLEVWSDIYLNDTFFADLDKCKPFRAISWDQQPWIKVQHFLVLAEKFDDIQAPYSLDRLYGIGATPMYRNLREVRVNGNTVNEATASDAWLALCGYDFDKEQNHEQNQTARRARDNLAEAIFSLAYDTRIKSAADEAGAMGIRSDYETTAPYLRPLFLGGHSFGLDRCVKTGSFNTRVKLAGVRLQDPEAIDAKRLTRYMDVALKANRGEPFTFAYLQNKGD